MVVEEVMFAYETLQRSRRLLSVEPCITVMKPRSCFGLQCSKLSKTTGLVDFENIPATSEIKISKKDRTESVKTTAVLNLVTFKPGLKMRRKKFAKGREREREQTGYIREQKGKKCGNREKEGNWIKTGNVLGKTVEKWDREESDFDVMRRESRVTFNNEKG